MPSPLLGSSLAIDTPNERNFDSGERTSRPKSLLYIRIPGTRLSFAQYSHNIVKVG
jgi:hypothetical protein